MITLIIAHKFFFVKSRKSIPQKICIFSDFFAKTWYNSEMKSSNSELSARITESCGSVGDGWGGTAFLGCAKLNNPYGLVGFGIRLFLYQKEHPSHLAWVVRETGL